MLWLERMISIVKHVFGSFQAYAWTFASQQDCRCRLCCDAVRGLARLPGGNLAAMGLGIPSCQGSKCPLWWLSLHASLAACSSATNLAAWQQKLMGNHWKGVQIRKPRWYRYHDILQDGYLFELAYLTYQLQCSCCMLPKTPTNRRQMIWRPEDSQPLPLPGPSSNFAAFRWTDCNFVCWYLEGFDFVYASSTSFWVVRIFFLIGQFSRNLFHSSRMLWLGCCSQYIEGRFSGGVRERVRQPGSGKVPKEVLQQHVTYFSLCLESHRNLFDVLRWRWTSPGYKVCLKVSVAF